MLKYHFCWFLLCFFSIVNGQTFYSSVNQTIPDDNTTVGFDLFISGLPTTINQNFGVASVCLNMTHTYCSDMEVKLKAPDGTQTLLFSGIGGGDDNFTNTCVEGTGSAIAAGVAPFTGSFQSMSVLGNVNNSQNPNGTWQLLCRDMYGADIGFLIDWQITFNNTPAQPFLFVSSNIPIVKLTTLNAPINDNVKVPVLMQIIDNGTGNINFSIDTNYSYEGQILTEWQGFTGPSYPKKNYDFDLINNSGVKIDTVLMGLPSENDFVFKAEYLDHSLLKNTITYEFARRMDQYAPRTKPCEIILDGEYIGYYTLTETIKRDQNRVDIANLSLNDTAGIDLTGGYIIEMNINGDPGAWYSNFDPINGATAGSAVEFKHVDPKASEILPVQANYIHAFVDSFETALNASTFTDPILGYRNFIDVSTFIDFLIVNEFSVNYDSYGRSTFMYKEKNTDGGKLKIGPPWDYDRALDYGNMGAAAGWVWEICHPYWPFPFWWSKMYTDPTYQKELACRWKTLRQDELKTENFIFFIDSMATLLQGPAERNFTIWNDLGGQTYSTQINSLKTFLTTRLDWIDNELAPFSNYEISLTLPKDTTSCVNLNYDASASNSNSLSYNWQPGPDSSTILIENSGTYFLQVTDEFGCQKKDSMQVQIFQTSDTTINTNALSLLILNGTAYSESGTYFQTLANSFGCDSLITLHLKIVTSDNALLVSPNPSIDNVLISLPIDFIGKKMELYDFTGRIVFSDMIISENQTISLINFTVGAYFLRVEGLPKIATIIKHM
jgi:subtilisin-like proprotein convertase family protein